MSKKKSLNTETGEILEIENPQPLYYQNSRNYRERRKRVIRVTERNDGVSETSPNLAFTSREIIKRFASGIPIKGFMIPTYETDGSVEATDTFSMEVYNRMDHEQKAEFQRSLIERQHEAEKRLKQAAQKEIDARRQKELENHTKNVLDAERKKWEEAQKKGGNTPS